MPAITKYTGPRYNLRYCGRELVCLPELHEMLKVIKKLGLKLSKISKGKSVADSEAACLYPSSIRGCS
jgi:hypothetical protein